MFNPFTHVRDRVLHRFPRLYMGGMLLALITAERWIDVESMSFEATFLALLLVAWGATTLVEDYSELREKELVS